MFNFVNKIGEGGFGKVFRGKLETEEVNFDLPVKFIVFILHFHEQIVEI